VLRSPVESLDMRGYGFPGWIHPILIKRFLPQACSSPLMYSCPLSH
jgi:hypothetical protein